MKTRNRVDPQHTAVNISVANSSTAALGTCILCKSSSLSRTNTDAQINVRADQQSIQCNPVRLTCQSLQNDLQQRCDACLICIHWQF